MKEKEQTFKAGDWVVKGERPTPMLIDEVKGDVVTVCVKTIFGNMSQNYSTEDLRPWTIDDVERGQYLTCATPDENKVIFISKGKDDPYQAIAGCNLKQDHIWFDEVCCLGYKECVRPATNDEIRLLDDILRRQQMHWNLDKKKLERIEDSGITLADREFNAAQEAKIKEMEKDIADMKALAKEADNVIEWARFRRQAAAMAMQGLLANPDKRKPCSNYGDTRFYNSSEIADEAVWYADALIEKLKEKKKEG